MTGKYHISAELKEQTQRQYLLLFQNIGDLDVLDYARNVHGMFRIGHVRSTLRFGPWRIDDDDIYDHDDSDVSVTMGANLDTTVNAYRWQPRRQIPAGSNLSNQGPGSRGAAGTSAAGNAIP